jgi:uncharacterized repeat protein (TIGR02059 family)
MKRTILLFFLALSPVVSATTYYVATNGNDSYTAVQAQNINTPWATWQKAVTMAYPGDIVYIRGGIYKPTAHIGASSACGILIRPQLSIGRSGTAANPICYFAYPPDYESGNPPILDCSLLSPVSRFNVGINLEFAEYIHIKGLVVCNVKQVTPATPDGNGGWNEDQAYGFDFVPTANVIVENCVVHDIMGRGYYYESWAWNSWDGTGASTHGDTTRFINCDAYNIFDALAGTPGNAADAWKGGNYVGGVVYFTGCRAWNYSDDAFDPGGAGKRIFDSCWVMSTEKYYDPNSSWPMEGNGFKTAGFGADQSGHYDPNDNFVILRNCIAAFCHGVGFYNNFNEPCLQNNAIYLNNTAYKNYAGFGDLYYNKPLARTTEYYNNVSIYNTAKQDPYDPLYEVEIYYPNVYPHSNNSWISTSSPNDWPGWQYNPAVTVTDADFVSVNANELTSPRKPNGSLPNINFLKLVAGSDLINKGKDVGLPFYGTAPDMGYSEYVTGSVIPPSPLYISSVIENSTPARLDMTYSTSLANIIPATSAFTVMVNSVGRNVTGVTISGTKVLLTLQSPVAYGDVVTVSYTKPSTNPLQTSAGGLAASIAGQNVVVNVVNTATLVYVSSSVENATPSRLEMNYSSTLANIVPASAAFTVKVNSVTRIVTAVAISGTKVLLTLVSPVVNGDVVTVDYKKPSVNLLQSVAGGFAESITLQPVTNNCQPLAGNNPPVVLISSPAADSHFSALATVNIAVTASDADGTISKIEFYEGSNKLGELTSAPWSYTWEYVVAGTYSIVAVATDNLNSSTSSAPVQIVVDVNPLFEGTSKISNLYPNPNDGSFEIYLTQPTQIINSEITIVSLDGRTIYNETIEPKEISKQLNLPFIKKGSYLIVLSCNGIIFDAKTFVKE